MDMATSEIKGNAIIRIRQSKNVSISSSGATTVTFNYTIPSGYTLVCPTLLHGYGIEVEGELESVTDTTATGFFQRKTGSALSVRFTFDAIAIRSDLLNSI